MPDLETAFESWRLGAVVCLVGPEGRDVFCRPAAFVYAIPRGFAWVEPSYADPYGASSPAYHERFGEAQAINAGFFFPNTDGGSESKAAVYPFDPADPAMEDEAGPLTWFAEHLKENGLQWQAERERVRALVSR